MCVNVFYRLPNLRQLAINETLFFLKNQKKSQGYKKKDTSISDLNTETLKEHCTEQFPGRQGQRARAMILLFSFYWHKKHRPAYQKDGGSPALTDTGVYREALEK